MPQALLIRRSLVLLAAVAGAALAAGCRYDYAPVLMEVRNRATLAPVPDATVRISNAHTLNPAPPTPSEGTTGAEGRVRLRAALYNTLLVRVSAPGHAAHLFNAEHPAVVGDVGWFTPRFNQQGDRGTLEVRLSPTRASRPDGPEGDGDETPAQPPSDPPVNDR